MVPDELLDEESPRMTVTAGYCIRVELLLLYDQLSCSHHQVMPQLALARPALHAEEVVPKAPIFNMSKSNIAAASFDLVVASAIIGFNRSHPLWFRRMPSPYLNGSEVWQARYSSSLLPTTLTFLTISQCNRLEKNKSFVQLTSYTTEPTDTQQLKRTLLTMLNPIRSRILSHRVRHLTTTSPFRSVTSHFSPGPSPPRLPKEQQEEFERLQRASTGAFSAPPSTNPENSTTIAAQTGSPPKIDEKDSGELLHPNIRRGAAPEFEGDVNPKTGEVGGPKNDPLRYGDYSYNGRVTDF